MIVKQSGRLKSQRKGHCKHGKIQVCIHKVNDLLI